MLPLSIEYFKVDIGEHGASLKTILKSKISAFKYTMSVLYYDFNVYDNGKAEVKIYTDGELKEIELGNYVFPHTYHGRVHVPGSYSFLDLTFEFLHKKENKSYSNMIYRLLTKDVRLSKCKYGYSNFVDYSSKNTYGVNLFNDLLKISYCHSYDTIKHFKAVDDAYFDYILTTDDNIHGIKGDNKDYFVIQKRIFNALYIRYLFSSGEHLGSKTLKDEMIYKCNRLHKFASKLLKEHEEQKSLGN